jgi:hypothetical protein
MPPIGGVAGGVTLKGKITEPDLFYSPVSTKVKNEWNCTTIPPFYFIMFTRKMATFTFIILCNLI